MIFQDLRPTAQFSEFVSVGLTKLNFRVFQGCKKQTFLWRIILWTDHIATTNLTIRMSKVHFQQRNII